jgi:excisionase family DNA binding protein
MESVSPLALGIAEAATVAGIGRTTLYAAISGGELQARKVGKRTLILHKDLLDWLNSRPSALSVRSSSRSKGGTHA